MDFELEYRILEQNYEKLRASLKATTSDMNLYESRWAEAERKLDKTLLQNDQLRKALAQYANVMLPGGICPANDLLSIEKPVDQSPKKCAVCGYSAHSGRCGEQGGSGPEDGYA